MSRVYEVFVESSVRGYHAYFKNSTVLIGDVLRCEIEENNEHDKYAVAVKDESDQVVGHVPIEVSRLFCKFIKDYGEVEAECIGDRFNAGQGKGLELPVDYKLVGNRNYLKNIVRRLESKNLGLDISDIKESDFFLPHGLDKNNV